MKVNDLNCDMGESFGVYRLGMFAEVINLLTSANIACGFHAGDPNRWTVRIAKENHVGTASIRAFPICLVLEEETRTFLL
ncbi:LamB/YcsF family protein [Peribacillus butanolivorans]|uniref:LamB/YcsF family protein n=1 Tax=Peribacillus butanolivorans TaxID=421767 RepID=UPI00269AD554